MKKIIQLLVLSSVFVSASVFGQTLQNPPCNTDEAMAELFASDPSAKVRYDQEQEKLRIALESYEKSLQNKKVGAAFQYTIPVVFHILHQYGSENIPDANCIAALANINNDFAASGSDVGTINSTFAPLYINSDIKFMLAKKDPLGNCTSGINHYADPNTDWDRSKTNQSVANFAYTGTSAGKWNPTKYLNIYVIKQICTSAGVCPSCVSGCVVGYTYKPGSWATGDPHDAFVIRSDYVSSNISDTRTLSHEIGHWLNLSHVWGNTNNAGVTCGDDGVADTPITTGTLTAGCPGSIGTNTCAGSGGNRNIENIMDYAGCPKMFTTGQTNVMRAALASATSGRNNLWSTTNLGPTQTDVNGTSSCAPIADFYTTSGVASNIYTVCAGGSLTFNDVSYNATVTSRNWAGSGGATVASPTAAVTSITFPNIGVQSVTLTVSNASGSTTKVKTVNVLNGLANYAATYQESFETVAGLPTNWSVLNQTGGVTWARYTSAAATGTASYYMNNTINPNGSIDILETPSYDFLNNPGAMFTFKYAYARETATFNDVFKIQASSNCGGSWSDIYVPSASTMASGSGGTTSTPFFPTPAQFKTYTLTTHPAFNVFKSQPNVRIRFYFQEDATTGFGNNLFLDDINFNGTLGVNELTKSIGLVVYPNPTSGSANIEFTLNDNSTISYSVIDVIGRVVEQQKTLDLSPGHHTYTINESNTFKPGIYFVTFQLNGQKMSRKLIVE